jgi:hypothetical protein
LTPGGCRAGWYSRRVRASAERGRVQGPGRAETDLGPRTLSVALLPGAIPGAPPERSTDISRPGVPPRMGPCRGPLIPPLMGPPGGGGLVGAGLGPFPLVRRSPGQGHEQNPRVTLPRFATLLSARSIHCPSMGLLRRPTPGEIVEGGQFARPCGPGALSRAISETNLRLRRHSPISMCRLLQLTNVVAVISLDLCDVHHNGGRRRTGGYLDAVWAGGTIQASGDRLASSSCARRRPLSFLQPGRGDCLAAAGMD